MQRTMLRKGLKLHTGMLTWSKRYLLMRTITSGPRMPMVFRYSLYYGQIQLSAVGWQRKKGREFSCSCVEFWSSRTLHISFVLSKSHGQLEALVDQSKSFHDSTKSALISVRRGYNFQSEPTECFIVKLKIKRCISRSIRLISAAG
jgi:hypothetical protein